VAQLCRSVCSETRLSMRAARAASCTVRFSWRVLPPALEHLALSSGDPPPGPQPLDHDGREHGVAILPALALLDAQRHARAVDIPDFERGDFARAQPRPLGDREGGLVLQVAHRGEQRADFLPTQDDGQCPWHKHRLHLRHQLAAIERDVEEELQSRDGRVERDRHGAAIDQVQLKVAQLFDGRGIGRTAQIPREAPNTAHVRGLRVGCELAQPHVIEHALTRRGNLSSGIIHGGQLGCEQARNNDH
jgi:hypothetical protein